MIKLHTMPIRNQLLLIVLIAALPAAGIIIFSGFEQRAKDIVDARVEMQKLAAIIASEQRTRIASAEQLLTTLAQLPDVKKHHPSRMEPLLIDLLKFHTQYSNIFLADLAGAVWASAVPMGSTVNVSDRRYFKNAMASQQLSSGEYLISRFTQKPVLTLAYPYRNEKNAIAGIIVLGFDLDYYKHLIGDSELPAKKGYLLLDHKGVILARSVNPEPYVGKPYDQEQFKMMQQGPDEGTGIIEKGIDGQKRYYAYSKQRLAGEKVPYLYIRASIPVETVLSATRMRIYRNLGLFTPFFLMALLLAWFIGKRSIVDRIALLEAASRKMAGGDLQIRVADQVNGAELGSLGKSFDHMALQLHEREQDRSKLINDLQQAVNTIKTLQGILPICSSCKKIRNDDGLWTQLEIYIRDHSEAEFSHGLCSDCATKLYPDMFKKEKQ
jgi:two-component system cell cycle sensor histidine kinase/response regulator CckA